mmetsp:Transcript_5733/g.12102  ORF Transcript_5733/g.12102 Transcript_5733/m.12102 type:complete len:103 (-) Transcript_5733:683-991(-)
MVLCDPVRKERILASSGMFSSCLQLNEPTRPSPTRALHRRSKLRASQHCKIHSMISASSAIQFSYTRALDHLEGDHPSHRYMENLTVATTYSSDGFTPISMP